MKGRGYQEKFYPQFSKLQDDQARHEKAEKIILTLKMIRQNLGELCCLDIGCSSGVITSEAQPFFKYMVGIDYDVAGLTLISDEQKKQSLFIRGDAMQLPFSNQSFDAIICAQIYEHVPDDHKLFSEIERVIRPGGVMFFSGPNKLFPIEPHYYLPFIHWFPEKTADLFLKKVKGKPYFDIKSRTIWNLRKILVNYDIYDMTLPVMRFISNQHNSVKNKAGKFFLKMPSFFWRGLLPLIPNFNWVLIKLENTNRPGGYYVMD